MARILIMEDDPLQAEVWTAALTGRGHEVSWTSGAEAALAALTAKSFDLLITDLFVPARLGRPPEGGLYLIGRMRTPGGVAATPSQSDLMHMPILCVTGASNAGARAFDPLGSARTLGATCGLRKPVETARLIEAVEQLV